MAVKILHKRSAVQFKSATGAQLELGELGLNYHESGPYLQCKDAAGEIVQLGGVYVGAAAPGNELQGAWWLRDSDNTLFLFDGTSWVSIAGGGGGGGGTTTVIGSDGIEAVTAGDVVTVSVDLATNSHGLSIVGGKLQADIATKTTLGTVKIGDGIDVDAAGEISVDLSGIDVNADLGYTAAADKGTVTNSAGDDATIPLADGTNAGLFTAAEKLKLDGIETGAQVNGKPVFIGENPPGTPADGDLWWNSSDDSGRLYVYYDDGDSQQWVEASPQGDTLTESDADDLYLSKVSDDTAEGEITFEKVTTHEAGVSVTGSNVRSAAAVNSKFIAAGSVPGTNGIGGGYLSDLTSLNDTEKVNGYNCRILPDLGSGDIVGYQQFQIASDIDGYDGNMFAFYANGNTTINSKNRLAAGKILAGFTSNYGIVRKNAAGNGDEPLVDADGKPNVYNFYSGGDAPNYFFAGLLAGSDTWDNTTNAAQLEGGRVRVAKTSGRPVTESPFEVYRQNTSGSEPYYLLMYLNGETTGVLKLNNSDQPGLHDISDYRLKSNIAELQDATSLVKQLKPCTFSIRNHNNVRGFVAHELQEIAPECVSGTKDATESIGTLIDWDGTELDTEVTEPIPEDLTYEEQVEATPYAAAVAATYDEYGNELTAEVPEVEATYTTVTRTRTWTPTGTQPVYQGVDQTKLIPLLTKALQEVMQKNEDLEARIAALEGA